MNKLKDYISYSQISTYLKSKKQFIDNYILGKKQFTTKQMMRGSITHNLLPLLLDGGDYEQEHNIIINDTLVKVIFDRVKDGVLYEYKTGKEWTQEAVNNHLQLHIYVLAYKVIHGEYPKKTYLGWIQNSILDDDNEYNLEDIDIKYIEYTINEEVLKETEELIKRVRSEIVSLFEEYEYINEI